MGGDCCGLPAATKVFAIVVPVHVHVMNGALETWIYFKTTGELVACVGQKGPHYYEEL